MAQRFDKFEPAFVPQHPAEHYMRELGITRELAQIMVEEIASSSYYRNRIYQVAVSYTENRAMAHLSIKRLDKAPIRDWRDLQRIKNELVGPECEGVELYPAESRLVDMANQYHLWVFTDPEYKIPFGFDGRWVSDVPLGKSVQRPFEEPPGP